MTSQFYSLKNFENLVAMHGNDCEIKFQHCLLCIDWKDSLWLLSLLLLLLLVVEV